jgi:signal transduction histidine kinase
LKNPKGSTEDTNQRDTSWAVCLVRWGVLASVLLIALFDPVHHLSPQHLGFFLAGFGAYNLLITTFLAFGLFARTVPAVTLVLDTIAILVLVHLSGGVSSPFALFPLFPILVATLQISWRVGLLSSGIFVLGYVLHIIFTWEEGAGIERIFQTGVSGLMFILTAIVGEVANRRLNLPEFGKRAAPSGTNSFVPEDMRMIYEMASTLSATLNYEKVLESILDISRMGFVDLGHRIGESVSMVLLYDKDGELFIASHRNLISREDETRRIRGRSGIVGQAISTAQAVITDGSAADEDLKAFQSLKKAKSMLCVPLRAGFETYGAVLFGSVKANAFSVEHLELLTIFCNQATIALQNASLYQSLREERDKIVDKEEQARRKLARDLHDGPTQDVAAIAMRLNFARLLLERDPARARQELERLEDLAHRTVKEIRSMLFTLRPVILETEGLVAALNQYADNLRENDRLPVEIDAERYRECLDTDAQGVVFAIIEEAVNNARKHANASKIWVRLAVENDLFVAQVADNGRGFDVEAVEKNYGSRGSLGMVNLKERAELVEGTINIESAPGQGTRITLLVPISKEPA